MTNRKLQAILFGVLLTFSAAAQSQTAVINNPILTFYAQTFVRSILSSPGSQSSVVQGVNRAATIVARVQPAGGSLVINGVVQETGTTQQLFDALVRLVTTSGFDPASSVVIRAASPNT